jgi:predicted TIM-barrel fold metal-dependent hydrolase
MSKRQQYLDVAVTEKADQPVETLIDSHTHIGQVRLEGLPVTPERLVEYMDTHGIDQSVVLPLESPMSSHYLVTTREVLDAANRYPDRLIPFCSIDPRMFYRWGRDRYVTVLERYIDRGARGFGELKCDLPIDHERMQLLYELCAEHGLPVVMHIDDFHCKDEVGLPATEAMVDTYSDVDFVMHAPGWWTHISADADATDGYPDGPVEPGGRCDELLTEYSNLYADFSMGSGFNAITRDEAYGQQFLERHHESLLFGSDYLYPGQEVMQFGFFEKFDLPSEAWENICSRNVSRLLA